MKHLPPITIVTPTWVPAGPAGEERAATVKRAVISWREHMLYAGELRLHVGDDGSLLPGYGQRAEGEPGFWWPKERHITFSRQERKGEGASLNAGLMAAYAVSPLALVVVDDWELQSDLDLTPWAEMILEYQDLGIVYLGQPLPWVSGAVECLRQGWILRLQRNHYSFGHRPGIYHKRAWDAYGEFATGVDAYECERLWALKWATEGKGLSTALALIHPWAHIGTVEVGHVDPTTEAGL